jgi:hypothetical protein
MKCVRFVRLLTRGTLRPASDIPDDPGLPRTQPGFAEHPSVVAVGVGADRGAAILCQLRLDAVRCGDRARPRSPDLRQRPRAVVLFIRAPSSGQRVLGYLTGMFQVRQRDLGELPAVACQEARTGSFGRSHLEFSSPKVGLRTWRRTNRIISDAWLAAG